MNQKLSLLGATEEVVEIGEGGILAVDRFRLVQQHLAVLPISPDALKLKKFF